MLPFAIVMGAISGLSIFSGMVMTSAVNPELEMIGLGTMLGQDGPAPVSASAPKWGPPTPEQEATLRLWLKGHPQQPFPNDQDRDHLVEQTGLPAHRVHAWFLTRFQKSKQDRTDAGQAPATRPAVTEQAASSTPADSLSSAPLSQAQEQLLNTWLFAHADHPYPSEQEWGDLLLATGLPEAQAYDWFRKVWRTRKRAIRQNAAQASMAEASERQQETAPLLR